MLRETQWYSLLAGGAAGLASEGPNWQANQSLPGLRWQAAGPHGFLSGVARPRNRQEQGWPEQGRTEQTPGELRLPAPHGG